MRERRLGDRPISGFVYIVANRRNGTIYTGVTADLAQRITRHRERTGSKFAAKWEAFKLVYIEPHDDMLAAIPREKAIKKWRRDWKIALIEQTNPDWRDLFFDINA